jgi:hypothetical protein
MRHKSAFLVHRHFWEAHMKSTYSTRLLDGLAQKRLSRDGFVARMKQQKEICRKEGRPIPAAGKRQIGKYLRGELQPRDEAFSREAASVLGINWLWLHEGRGDMTTAVITATATLTATAPSRIITNSVLRPYDGLATAERLRQIAKPIADRPAALAAYATAWDSVVGRISPLPEPEEQLRLAAKLWASVVTLLETMRVSPRRASDGFYLGVFGAVAGIPSK